MLEKGWPDLYERVLDRELSPFEALLKTGWVDSEDVCEIFGKNGGTQEDVGDEFPPYQRIDQNREVDEIVEEILKGF